MIRIKYKNRNGKWVNVKNKFKTEQAAQDYISVKFKDNTDVIIEEDKSDEKLDLTPCIGQWLWIYSEKAKCFYSYGLLIEVTKCCAKFQTKEDFPDPFYFSEITFTKIKSLIDAKKAYFSVEGHFSNFKLYQ